MTMPGFVSLQKFAVQSSVFVYIGTHVRVKCDKSLAKYSKINTSKVSASSLFTSDSIRQALGC